MKGKSAVSLVKMREYASKAIKYIEGLDYNDFINDSKTVEACVFNISQIGELVKHLKPSIILKYNNVDWHGIKGLRNRLIHDYEGIKMRIIWSVLIEGLPKLINDIDAILKEEKKLLE